MNWAEALDKWLFTQINGIYTTPLADCFMPYFRQPYFWAPLYVFLLAYILYHFRHQSLRWITHFLLMVGISDFISSSIIKPFFGRIRPCNDPTLFDSIRFLAAYCGGNGSFTSTHAANHFAMATFLFISLKQHTPFLRWIFFGWAALIGYSQVYVGVHYPGDVLGGACLGCLIGYVSGSLFVQKKGYLQPLSS